MGQRKYTYLGSYKVRYNGTGAVIALPQTYMIDQEVYIGDELTAYKGPQGEIVFVKKGVDIENS